MNPVISGVLGSFIESGKINMVIDGQFGSTGKGLIAGSVAMTNEIHLSIGRLSPNAGHTFYIDDKKYVTKMLPVSSIVHDRCAIYLCAGSVIDIDILFQEIEKFNIDPSRLFIHPRAAIVTEDARRMEQKKDGVVKIASTQSGTGGARADKIMRNNPLAFRCDALKEFVRNYFDISEYISHGLNILVETGQGFDLSLNHGYSYPYCTSTDVIPAAILGDIGLHPGDLGKILMVIRTYPIRVGNIIDDDGREIGYSGDVYPDSKELTWEELGQIEERTTVTNRVRRVFTFSKQQYIRSLKFIRPDLIFLNFVNYVRPSDLGWLKSALSVRKPDLIGYGPHSEEISDWDDDVIENIIYSHC